MQQVIVMSHNYPSLQLTAGTCKRDGLKKIVSFWGKRPIFRGKLAVSFRECMTFQFTDWFMTGSKSSEVCFNRHATSKHFFHQKKKQQKNRVIPSPVSYILETLPSGNLARKRLP